MIMIIIITIPRTIIIIIIIIIVVIRKYQKYFDLAVTVKYFRFRPGVIAL